MSTRRRLLLGTTALVATALPCCSKPADQVRISGAPRPTAWEPPRASPSSEDAPTARAADLPVRTPSGHFLVGKERLAALRADPRAAAGEHWTALLENAEHAIRSFDPGSSSAENVATAYLVTRDARFAAGAFKWFEMGAKGDVRWDSYLTFGDHMRGAAFVLDYCGDALSRDQRKAIADYLEKWTNELWFDNRGSGWGLRDPGNNYHYAFLEGTAYAAYALEAEKRPSAQRFIELLREQIERPDGVLDYLTHGGRGGDWHEGANYGERSKQRMFSAFAAIVSMGGPDYFARTPFPDEAVLYAAYQVQPGRRFLAPTGDLARDSAADVTPFDRDYVQLAGHFTADPRTRALAAWYLTAVAPGYVSNAVRTRGLLYRDVLLPPPGPPAGPTKLPLGYRSPGTDWLNARSSWSDDATSLTVVATPQWTQSHAHLDSGSFVLWRGGWQAVDAGTYGRSGLNWSASAHNMIQVAGHARGTGKSRGLVRYVDDGRLFYAQIDGSSLFTRHVGESYLPMLDEWTRELLFFRPGTLVVYDRVAPKPEGKDYSWRVHFANKPVWGAGRYSAANESGAIAVTMLDGGDARIAQDTDLPDGPTTAWRLEVLPNAKNRFLARIEVARAGAVPPTTTQAISGAGIQGLAWGSQVVVFSAAPLGRPASLPFTYRVKDTGRHAHTLVDMEGGCDVEVSRADGFVVVRVVPGARYRADQNGLVRFSD